MKIHYFFKRSYGDFYDLEIAAWLEEKEVSRRGQKRLSFIRLERLKILLSKDNRKYHNHLIEHDFGNESCIEHFTHTRAELMLSMKRRGMKPINQRDYERFRKVALSLYNQQPLVDFSKFKGKQKCSIHQIIED